MIKDKLPEFAPSPNLKDRPNEVNVSTTSKPNDVTAVPPEEKFVIAGSNFE